MSNETAEEFIKRKYEAALKLIDEAMKGNALIMPISTIDGINQTGLPTIAIQFNIDERKLQAFREGKSK